MSGIETERKFLVRRGSDFKSQAVSSSLIRQGYMPCKGATVRVRTRDDKAYLTIKAHAKQGSIGRYEFETEITPDEASHLLELCAGGTVEKRRYLVPCGAHTFEVDEFHGENEGLVMAEVELSSEGESYEKPGFIGPEVTADRRFRNSSLLSFPYRLWSNTIPVEYR